MSNSKSFKFAIIGAACAAGIGALGYFYFLNNNASGYVPKKNVKNLSKASTIKVLKQLKKELFASFQTMSMFAQQIKVQARGRATEAEVKQFVCEHPQISQGLKAGEEKAYKKCNITEDEFRNAVENLFKDDKDVQTHRNEIKSMFDKAAMGVQLDIKTDIPQSLTSQNTVQIIEKIMKETCRKMQEAFLQIVEDGGVVNMNDPQTIQALNGVKIDDVKTKILEEAGLEQYDDSGDKILSYATQKYGKDNVDGFQEKMMDLETKQRKSMELIQSNPRDTTIIDKTFAEPAQVMGGAPGMGGMGGMGGAFGIGKRTQRGEKIQRDEEKKTEEKVEEKAEEKTEEKAEEKTEEKAEEVNPEEPQAATEEPKAEEKQQEEEMPELKEQEQQQVEEQVEEKQEEEVQQEQQQEEVQEQKQEEVQQEEPVVEQQQEQVYDFSIVKEDKQEEPVVEQQQVEEEQQQQEQQQQQE